MNSLNEKVLNFNRKVKIDFEGGDLTSDAADELRHDPTFIEVLDKEDLASQPTISRFNNRVSVETLKSHQKINELLFDKMYSLEIP